MISHYKTILTVKSFRHLGRITIQIMWGLRAQAIEAGKALQHSHSQQENFAPGNSVLGTETEGRAV